MWKKWSELSDQTMAKAVAPRRRQQPGKGGKRRHNQSRRAAGRGQREWQAATWQKQLKGVTVINYFVVW